MQFFLNIKDNYRMDRQVSENQSFRKRDACNDKTATPVNQEVSSNIYPFHSISLEEVCQKFNTNLQTGLTDVQLKYNSSLGANLLSPINKKPKWLIFLAKLFQGFSILLWIGVALCLLVYSTQVIIFSEHPPYDNVWLSCIMLVVILINASFAYFQENKMGDISESFRKLTPHSATVIRNGETFHIVADKVVLGDLLVVQAGDRIPADLRISKCQNFKVNNSALTGESKPQIRTIDCTHEDYHYSQNIAFFSTFAVEGSAEGIVVAVGDNTIVGKMGSKSSSVEIPSSPLANEVNNFLRLISCLAVFCGFISAILTISMGYSWSDSIMFLVAISLANIPLGLVYFITIFLVIVAKELASRNCRVKSLNAVETLGSTTVICSDKTGTLTQNLLAVSQLWFNNLVCNDFQKDVLFLEENQVQNLKMGFNRIANVAVLCNSARIHCGILNNEKIMSKENGLQSRNWIGNSTDEALIQYFDSQMSVNVQEIKLSHKKLYELQFNSTSKYHAVLYQLISKCGTLSSKYVLVMKGAPERILQSCNKILINNEEIQLSSEWLNEIESKFQELAVTGARVVAFCDVQFEIPDTEAAAFLDELSPSTLSNLMFKGLCFIGLAAFEDPIRDGAQEFVTKCKTAGVKVVMLTGDHFTTAQTIAKNIGIFSTRQTIPEGLIEEDILQISTSNVKQIAINGLELSNMTDQSLQELLKSYDEIIFTRISPSQKLLIVQGFQSVGEIVAVLGDGVNDCLALKKADIGIAVGENASEVSKEIADMVLTDGNISSVVFAIELGRLMFENLKKCCFYSITDSMPFIVPFIFFILFKIPQPLGAVSMVVISLATDMLPAISLVFEKPNSEMIKESPRDPKKKSLVTTKLVSYSYGQIGMLEACSGMFNYFVIMAQNGFHPWKLLWLRDSWDSIAINDLVDSYGQEWTYFDRKRLECTAQTGFFLSVVMTQWATLIISKANRASIFTTGMSNWMLNFALVSETLIALFFIYTPGMELLGFLPLKWNWWLPPLPYFFMIVFYNELRCLVMRIFKGSWLQREFNY